NGAFFLAKAGLLDGLEATTFAGLIDGLREAAPKARIVTDKRWVDNGKIITTAGLSSGIDGSLHVIEKLLGRGYAQRAALGMEYNWQPELNWARAALPDRMVRVDTPSDLPVEPLLTQGTTDRWGKAVVRRHRAVRRRLPEAGGPTPGDLEQVGPRIRRLDLQGRSGPRLERHRRCRAALDGQAKADDEDRAARLSGQNFCPLLGSWA
ncbi:MAG TPA: hypothetical protein VFR31_05110, partial [Thermoanaerobaculia bacterium]|nr:hypothetical protein [Thermoanaerobaculia bacterium]